MQFLKFFRFRGFRKAKDTSATIIFPSDWPSYLHSKCSTPTCWFPNPPQAAAGTYNCQGRPKGSYCKGTYSVTSAMADSTIRNSRQKRRSKEIRARNAVEAEVPTREPALKKQPSKLSIFRGNSQKALKDAFRKQEYLNNKSLPSIPGLSQRKVNRTRFVPQPPPPVPVDPMNDLKPLYPQVVLHYYFPHDQLSNPAFHSNSTNRCEPPLASSRPLVPHRQPQSGNYTSNSSGASLPHRRPDQNPGRPQHHGQPYRYHRF